MQPVWTQSGWQVGEVEVGCQKDGRDGGGGKLGWWVYQPGGIGSQPRPARGLGLDFLHGWTGNWHSGTRAHGHSRVTKD